MRLCIVSFFFLFFYGKAVAEDNWQNISLVYDKDTVAVFKMPEIPEEKTLDENGIPTRVYQSRNLFCIFGAVCSDFTLKREMLSPEYRGSMMEILVAGSVPKEIYGKLKSKKLISENPFRYEICYTVEYENVQWTYQKRFMIEDDRLFQFSIGAKTKNSMEMEHFSRQFFKSVVFR